MVCFGAKVARYIGMTTSAANRRAVAEELPGKEAQVRF